MWAEFGAIHALPWMEAVTQRCHILQGDGVPCAVDDPLDLRKHWKPGFLLPKHIHNSKKQRKSQATTDMAQDAI